MEITRFIIEAQREAERRMETKLQPRHIEWDDVPSYTDRTIRLGTVIAAIGHNGHVNERDSDYQDPMVESILYGRERMSPAKLGEFIAHNSSLYGDREQRIRQAEHLIREVAEHCIYSDHEQRNSRIPSTHDHSFDADNGAHASVLLSAERVALLAPLMRLELSETDLIWALRAYARCARAMRLRTKSRGLTPFELRQCALVVTRVFAATPEDGYYEPPAAT